MEFLKKNAHALAARPVWLFSSGPTGEGDALELLKGWRIPAEIQPAVDQIKPRDIAVFHGSLDNEKMGFMEKWVIQNICKRRWATSGIGKRSLPGRSRSVRP